MNNAKRPKYKEIGHVYIVESTDGLSVKIGRSRNPHKRISTIRTSANASGRFYISPKQANCVRLELDLHRMLAEFRLLGEWFSLSFDDAVCRVSSLIKEEITKEDLDSAIFDEKKSADIIFNKTMQKFYPQNVNVNKITDHVMLESLRLSKYIQIVITDNLIGGDIFNHKESLGWISEFELILSIYIYDMPDKSDIGWLIREAADASESVELCHEFYFSIRDSVFDKNKTTSALSV